MNIHIFLNYFGLRNDFYGHCTQIFIP